MKPPSQPASSGSTSFFHATVRPSASHTSLTTSSFSACRMLLVVYQISVALSSARERAAAVRRWVWELLKALSTFCESRRQRASARREKRPEFEQGGSTMIRSKRSASACEADSQSGRSSSTFFETHLTLSSRPNLAIVSLRVRSLYSAISFAVMSASVKTSASRAVLLPGAAQRSRIFDGAPVRSQRLTAAYEKRETTVAF
mmetsp:Transcript_1785/g.4835  ORF Transcript_1785/g.4835 Transcript_1785/m.4835 type:complete len:202 (-) Transcript_1785:345-950(-)